jgi:hypothetical protein
MPPILDLPDPEKGREMFEGLYGPEKGRRRFRALLKVLVPLAVIAAVLFVLAQMTTSGTAIYSGIRGWFSPASISQPPPISLQPPVNGQKCSINGGVNNGTQIQNCTN